MSSGQILTYVTVGEILSAALGKTIGAANQQPSELQDSALIREIEDLNREFHREGRKIMKKPFWWMEEFYNFKTFDRTTIGALTALTTTSAAIASATGWPSGSTGGVFHIFDTDTGSVDFITFTNLSSLTVTLTASTIDIDHSADSNAELLYKVPTNFGEFIGMNLDRVPYYPIDPTPDILPQNPYFWFKGNFFLFPAQIGAHTATLRYWKKCATLDTGDAATDKTTSTDIVDDYKNWAILRLAAIISKVRRRYDMEKSFNEEARARLLEICQFEVNATASPFQTIGPSW